MDWLGRAGGQEKADPPYSAVTNSRKLWEYHLDQHQRHVTGAFAVVDHGAPKCHDPRMVKVQENTRKFLVNERQAEIGRENRKLVGRLAEISNRNCGGGSGGPPPGNSRSSSQPPIATSLLHEPLRRRISKGIQQDNEQLVKRILAVKTSMNTRGMERDFKRHKKYSQNLRRIPGNEEYSRQRKPRSLPPLHERMRPASDPMRPPEGLLLPGDLCRMPRSESGPASLEGSPTMQPMQSSSRHSHSASTLREPQPRPEATDSEENVSPLAATKPLSSMGGSTSPSRDSPASRPGGSPGGAGVASKRPPRPDSGSKNRSQGPPATQSEDLSQQPIERQTTTHSLHSQESQDSQWQQSDKQTERRSWVAQPAAEPGNTDASNQSSMQSSGNKRGSRRQRDSPSGKDQMNRSLGSSGTSDLQYEDDWDTWSQDSPSKSQSKGFDS